MSRLGRSRSTVSLGSSKSAPFNWTSWCTTRSLFFLDGTIIDVGGTKYFKDRSSAARNFLITGYDFDSTWTKGFPYKSAATISAPAGDAVLIAADINNFLYDAGGTPNAIPVVSLFQNIDYENKIYCRHVAQVVDGNGVETTEPHVIEVFMTAAALSAADLVKADTYFGVPADDHSAGFMVAKSGGNYTSIKTAAAAAPTGTIIYVKTGVYANETIAITNKGLTIKGLGFVTQPQNASGCFHISDTSGTLTTIEGLRIIGTAQIAVRQTGSCNVLVNKCVLSGSNSLYGPADSLPITIRNSVIIAGTLTSKSSVINLDTNCFASITNLITSDYNLSCTNNKFKGSGAGVICARAAGTTSISFLGDTFLAGSLLADAAIATVATITVNYCNVTIAGAFASLINAASKVSFVITNNIINSAGTSASLFSFKGYDITFSGNTITGVNGNILLATALAVGKTLTFDDNKCVSTLTGEVSATDYIVHAAGNIMISDVQSAIYVIPVSNATMPAIIHNNYMVSKVGTHPFVITGTEYSAATQGYLDGSKVYNNRFSGPADWGNAPGVMHGIFNAGQAIEYYYNYLSGSFLGFVLKSNGSTIVSKIHHNLIKNCGEGFTVKGWKGALIYNNTISESFGYNGLAEGHAGFTGDSGDVEIKNNIFNDLTHNTAPILVWNDATQFVGCVSNRNLLYIPLSTGLHVAQIAADVYDFVEWQALGNDVNSINQNASLNANLIPATPFAIGEDLGTDYDDGLDSSTDWGDENTVPTIVTKQQGAAWDIGAYVH